MRAHLARRLAHARRGQHLNRSALACRAAMPSSASAWRHLATPSMTARASPLATDAAAASCRRAFSTGPRDGQEARIAAEDKHSRIVETYFSLGALCESRQDYAAAKEYYYKAMTTILQDPVYDLGEPYDLAATYESLGYMSFNLNQWDDALDYFKKHITESAKTHYCVRDCVIDPTADLPKDLHNAILAEGRTKRNYRFLSIIQMLGSVAAKNGDYASAKGYCLKRISLEYELCADDLKGVSLNLASLHYDFGKLALELGHPADALEHLEKTLEYEISEHGPDNVDVAITHNTLGDAAKAMGDFATARGHYERTLAIREDDAGVGTGVHGLRGDDRDVLLAKVAECAEALAPPPDFDAMRELHAVAERGDVDAMTQLLDGGAAVDQARGDGATPLGIACVAGQVDAARLLLEKGAEVDRAGETGQWKGATPLLVACAYGHVDVAQLLLDKGAEVDRAKEGGATPLFVACQEGHVDAVRLLLDNGAEVDRAREDGVTPLFFACHQGHVDAALLLLDKGAEVDRAHKNGVTPLFAACYNGHVDAARLVLEKGAEVDRADKDGQTPLWTACFKGHVDAARLVLENGAEVNLAAKNGTTPLYTACYNGHVEAARLLLDRGADVDRAMKDGETPLYIACQNGHVDVAQMLLERGAAIDRTKQDATPLYIACQQGHVDVVRLLLDKGADVNRARENGATPLIIACQYGRVDAARLLLDNGADVNRAAENGSTPLSIAKSQGHSSIVALLEEHQK